ncbi:MAG: hypothetical protein Q4Q25_03260, partial [Methanocorpusculum sp.]|nr:hypothetical protein [Methanocorpusculum sp.]
MTEIELIRNRCIADTMFATRYFFKQQEGRKFVVGDHHRKIADALDSVFSGKVTRLIINVPPRHTKTEFLKAFVKMGLAINPKSKYIMTSYSAKLAEDNSENIKNAITADWYKELFPWVQVDWGSHGKQKWYTTEGGGVYAASSGGQITGFGAGLVREANEPDTAAETPDTATKHPWGGAIIIDDPLKPVDAESPVMREKVNYWFENTIRSRVNDRSTPIIIIMQRLHKNDLCGYLLGLEPHEWTVLSLPALTTDEDGVEHALWPHRFDVEDLHKLRAANRFIFETQYQQNPQAINEKLWLFAFEREKHTGHVEYDPSQPLYLSFDFNRNPMTCTRCARYQVLPHRERHNAHGLPGDTPGLSGRVHPRYGRLRRQEPNDRQSAQQLPSGQGILRALSKPNAVLRKQPTIGSQPVLH